ncbi:MAG: hypothetical protein UHO63_08705 [Blautia sp.]|nr:hypothetical protein [Blautia sp.]
MKNLVLHDVSQDSAYRYTGITTFENLAEVTGDYPFEEDVMEKAAIHKQTMMSQQNGISSFGVTLRISPNAEILEDGESLHFMFDEFEIRDGKSKCAAVSMLEPEYLEDNWVKVQVFVLDQEKMNRL